MSRYPIAVVAGSLRRESFNKRLAHAITTLAPASERRAAQAAHAFFDGCRGAAEELDLSDRPRTRLALEAYASSAPEIMTQLNLGNPAMKERLASLYLTMHGVIERKQ